MYMHTTRINTKKELRRNPRKEAPMARIIFHIDVNSAFLSWTAVEQLKNGSKVDLREIPAIIGGDQSSRHGIVLAKSSLAKSYGIQTGEPVVNAFRKCPNLVTAPPNHKMYREKSRMLMDFLRTYTKKIEQVRQIRRLSAGGHGLPWRLHRRRRYGSAAGEVPADAGAVQGSGGAGQPNGFGVYGGH